jgi:2'-5' RNA ligase
MAQNLETQTELFGVKPASFEYYPVLLPNEASMAEFLVLNQRLIEEGIKPSNLTKLLHVSIDGIICRENDKKVTEDITNFLSSQKAFSIEFSELGYFTGKGGITLKLGIENADEIKVFNKNFMEAIGGKITKLNLHLTLARYVNRELFESLTSPEIIYPKSCICNSVAIYKKQLNAKGAYEVIGRVPFGG